MAYIDKTYTDSYQDYKKFKDWADAQVVTFFNGHTENLGYRVWEWEEADFDGTVRPIMNTPTWMDVYLIQNCPCKFVIDRMKEVYSEEFHREAMLRDFTAIPEGYKQNRRISIQRKGARFPIHNKPYPTRNKRRLKWWLQGPDDFWYHHDTKTWVNDTDILYPWISNTTHVSSLKSLVRHMRKQYLPIGVEFRVMGNYVGEEYSVVVGK